MSEFLFTSESVSEGHPDKVADQISDAVLDAILSQDKTSRVAAETLVKDNLVVLAGDIANGAAGIEWAKRTFSGPVIYLAGNHEYYEGEFDSVQQAMRAAARLR